MTPIATNSPAYSIQNLPLEERPRERLLRHGAEAMATSDLIAIILGSGMKGIPILQLSQSIIAHFGSIDKLAGATVEELCKIKGLGHAKALQLKAAFSLSTRLSKQAVTIKYRIENPIHAYNLIKEELQNESRELFLVILQDTKGCAITHQIVSIGTLTNVLVHPREVFYPAIRHHAASLILVHNHPSGDATPSKQDYDLTQTLIEVGKVMGIPVNDHLVVGDNCFTSMRQLREIIF